jgi:hypothetical protein
MFLELVFVPVYCGVFVDYFLLHLFVSPVSFPPRIELMHSHHYVWIFLHCILINNFRGDGYDFHVSVCYIYFCDPGNLAKGCFLVYKGSRRSPVSASKRNHRETLLCTSQEIEFWRFCLYYNTVYQCWSICRAIHGSEQIIRSRKRFSEITAFEMGY